MEFSDPSEREKVLGPLYATAIKDELAVFGSNGLMSKKTAAAIDDEVKKALTLGTDPMVDVLTPQDASASRAASDASAIESFVDEFTQLNTEPKKSKSKLVASVASPELVISKPVFSSRELYDRSHYSALSHLPSTKSAHEQLDHVMLRRATEGYLFDCVANKDVIEEDPWLQDVWEWIAGRS